MELTDLRHLFERAATERGLNIAVREKPDAKNPKLAISSHGSVIIVHGNDAGTRDLDELVNERLGALERKLRIAGGA